MSEQKNVESILSELGRKIDHLIDETKKAGAKVSEETELKIQNLKERKDKIEEDIKDKTANTGEKWIKAKSHLNEAADALRLAAEAIFKKDK